MFRFKTRDLRWPMVVVALGVAFGSYFILTPRLTLSPIKGSATMDGIPASFVMLEFHFSDGTRGAALTGEDGKFVLSELAMSNQGHFRNIPRSARVVAWEVRPATTAIPSRYRSVETTPLSVPISRGKNEFTIEISAP